MITDTSVGNEFPSKSGWALPQRWDEELDSLRGTLIRASARPRWKEPVEVVWASDKDVFWVPPWVRWSRHVPPREGSRKTQDTLERQHTCWLTWECFGVPPDMPGKLARDNFPGNCSGCCPHDLAPDKKKKIHGWMDVSTNSCHFTQWRHCVSSGWQWDCLAYIFALRLTCTSLYAIRATHGVFNIFPAALIMTLRTVVPYYFFFITVSFIY